MGEEDRGRVVRGLRQQAGEVVDAVRPCAAPQQRQLVAEPEEPERPAAVLEPDRVVLEHRDADRRQRARRRDRPSAPALRGGIVPPVVVAEDGVNAERSQRAARRGAISSMPISRLVKRWPAT